MEGSAPSGKSSRNTIIILSVILFFVAIFLYHGIYKMNFEFNDADVKDYINEEAIKHPEAKRPAIYKMIQDGVKYILDDRNLTRQVVRQAKINGTPRELELVHSSIMQNKANGYLNI